MTPHDDIKLLGVHPELVSRLARVLQAMSSLGYPMCVTDGVRTKAQQQALYAKGRTAPGPIVTNADGTPKEQGGAGVSNHQPRLDTYGHAADCAFIVDDKPSWDLQLPWHAYGACAQALGLSWGGAWSDPRLHDFPHVELI